MFAVRAERFEVVGVQVFIVECVPGKFGPASSSVEHGIISRLYRREQNYRAVCRGISDLGDDRVSPNAVPISICWLSGLNIFVELA